MKIEKLENSYLDKCRSIFHEMRNKSISETNNWEHVNEDQADNDWDMLYKELTPLIDISDSSAKNVQVLVERHYQIVSRFYKPTKDVYIGLALFYNENQELKDYHNSFHPQMVSFLGDVISIYAHQNL